MARTETIPNRRVVIKPEVGGGAERAVAALLRPVLSEKQVARFCAGDLVGFRYVGFGLIARPGARI